MKTPPSRLVLGARAALFAALLAGPALAELSQPYVDWGNGPTRHLFTAEETARWAQLATDADAEAFVRLFWARRDPDPATADNEARLEFERRVAFADQQFAVTEGEAPVRGAMTDRGRVLVLLGPPRRVEAPGSERTAEGGDVGFGGGADLDRGARTGSGSGHFGTGAGTERAGGVSEERWVYEDEQKPAFVKGRRLVVRFRSAGSSNEFMELHDSQQALTAMATAVDMMVVDPDLTIADVAVGSAGATLGADEVAGWGVVELADDGPLAALRAAPADAAGTAYHLTTGVFQAGDGTWIAPLQVATTAAQPPAGDVVGELVAAGAEGESVARFRLEGEWQGSTSQQVAQATLAPPPGDYELRVGVVGADGAVAWADRAELRVPQETEGLWLSPLLVSDNIYTLPSPQHMLEPYRWQGVAVVPRGDETFAHGTAMWFYVHACGAQLDPAGQPALRVVAAITGPKRFRAPLNALPSRAGDECWIVAQALDLLPEAFPAGEYEMQLQVSDTIAGKVASTQPVTFRVTD